MHRIINRWTLSALALIVIITIGTGFIVSRYESPPSFVITFEPPPQTTGRIYVDGSVAAPGWYDLRPGDTFAGIISAAGGTSTLSSNITLRIGAVTGAQKININTAAPWLLEALPGIGEGRAQAIVRYREIHGWFRDIDDLLNVDGIGPAILDDIRDLVTAGE